MSLQRRMAVPLLVLLAVGLCVYGRLATAQFVAWDDPDMVFQNARLNPPSVAHVINFWTHEDLGLYTPIPYTVWSVIVAMHRGPLDLDHGGAAFHVLNVLLHLTASCMVFLLLKELTTGQWPAWVGAMVFMLHPLQVEPAGWIAGMNNLACGAFAMAALWQYVRFAKTSARKHFVVATVLFVAALLCKPIAVMAPAIAIILDHWVLKRPAKQIVRPASVWLGLAIVLALVTRLVQPAMKIPAPGLIGRLLVASDSIGFYVTKIFIPINLVIDYERTPDVVLAQPWLAIPGLASIFICTIAFFLARGKSAWLRAPLLIVPIALLPVLGLTAFDFQAYSTVADRYAYLAMFGVALFVAGAMQRAGDSVIAWTVAVILLSLLAGRCFDQTAVWHDTETLANQEFVFDQFSPTGHKIYAHSLSARKEDQKAEAEFKAAIAALTEHPMNGDGAVWFNYGNLLTRDHRYQEAIVEYKLAIPRLSRLQGAEAYLNMGRAYYLSGDSSGARKQFLNALRLNPDYAEAKKNLKLLDRKTSG